MTPQRTAGATSKGTELARIVMQRFVDRTGVLARAGCDRRYLWTDAFAVCNLLALHAATGDPHQLLAARALVQHVHEVLGRHRPDDVRTGWISGLPEAEGRAHPTRCGLRIGKPLPERDPGAPMVERQEWDRDGQYFHYLTKWAHALARMAVVTRETRFLAQAVELAVAAHAAFTYTRVEDGARMMHWKMSIDLRRPLVASMSPHDPIDGLLTTMELQAALAAAGLPADPRLQALRRDFTRMEAATDATTADPLGIGGLLTGAHALAQLMARDAEREPGLLQRLLARAALGVDACLRGGSLTQPTRNRLAFRELGLAIGLRAVDGMRSLWGRESARLGGDPMRRRLEALGRHVPVGAAITHQWADPGCHQEPSWTAHLDINEVMLATSLLPDGFLAA